MNPHPFFFFYFAPSPFYPNAQKKINISLSDQNICQEQNHQSRTGRQGRRRKAKTAVKHCGPAWAVALTRHHRLRVDFSCQNKDKRAPDMLDDGAGVLLGGRLVGSSMQEVFSLCSYIQYTIRLFGGCKRHTRFSLSV